MRKAHILLLILLALIIVPDFSKAQEATKKKKKRTGSMYISWGYNHEWYTRSTVHVHQPNIGSDYDLVHVKAHDHKGWDNRLLDQQLSIPQYNWRIGYYFGEKQDMAIEMNFDHTKYIIADGQNIHLKGTLNDVATDKEIMFSQANGFYYFLNNGANFLLFNFVKRWGLYNTQDQKLRIDFIGKAGVGPVVPHVQNSFFGHANQQHFQVGGWNTGLETVVRITFMKYAFVEFSQKVDYARYSNLKIYEGTCKQNFGTYELILSGGFIFPTTKHNPWFVSGQHEAAPAPATEAK